MRLDHSFVDISQSGLSGFHLGVQFLQNAIAYNRDAAFLGLTGVNKHFFYHSSLLFFVLFISTFPCRRPLSSRRECFLLYKFFDLFPQFIFPHPISGRKNDHRHVFADHRPNDTPCSAPFRSVQLVGLCSNQYERLFVSLQVNVSASYPIQWRSPGVNDDNYSSELLAALDVGLHHRAPFFFDLLRHPCKIHTRQVRQILHHR